MSDDMKEPNLVDEVKVELDSLENSDLKEKVERYEALHSKLNNALTVIEGM